MQKLVALLAAFVIFSFSFAGEDADSSAVPCLESALSHGLHDSVDTDASATPSFEKQASESSHSAAAHDCHFGHCGFTLAIAPAVGTPFYLEAPDSFSIPARPSTGVRSETLRPPARA